VLSCELSVAFGGLIMDKKTELAIDLGQTIYNNTIRNLQAKIDAQAEELAALREVVTKQDSNTKQFRRFINSIYEIALKEPGNKDAADSLYISNILFAANLIDKKGNPTPLLTGVKE
jgi:hypothetical protein